MPNTLDTTVAGLRTAADVERLPMVMEQLLAGLDEGILSFSRPLSGLGAEPVHRYREGRWQWRVTVRPRLCAARGEAGGGHVRDHRRHRGDVAAGQHQPGPPRRGR